MTDTELYRTLWLAPAVGAMRTVRLGVDCGEKWMTHAQKLIEGMGSCTEHSRTEELTRELSEFAKEASSAAGDQIQDGIDELRRLAADQ